MKNLCIITGVRAIIPIERLNFYKPKLMAYVEQGGNLIVQYNANNTISKSE